MCANYEYMRSYDVPPQIPMSIAKIGKGSSLRLVRGNEEMFG